MKCLLIYASENLVDDKEQDGKRIFQTTMWAIDKCIQIVQSWSCLHFEKAWANFRVHKQEHLWHLVWKFIIEICKCMRTIEVLES